MSTNLTTYELINRYLELQFFEDTPELYEPDGGINDTLTEEKEDIERAMLEKAGNIHWVLTHMDQAEGSLKGQMDTHKNYLSKLRKKQQSLDNARKRLKDLIINLVIVRGEENKAGNPQIKTDTDTYTVFEGYGSVEITDPSEVPDNFIKLKQSYDNKAIRNAVIEADGETEYAECEKKKRLRIT